MNVPTKAEQRPPLRPIHWADLEGRERPPYLVKGVLNAGRFSVAYGEPGAMKTFAMIDLAAHVALGRAWHGQRVRGGPVLYVACEGGTSIEDRLAAFCQHHGVERAGVPLYVLPQAINFGDKAKGDVMRLIEAIKAIGDVRLVVIDTLSRALFGGNENSPDDMGAFVAVCDAVRAATEAHVLVVHHTGKDVDRGARGHSSLKAAVDTELVVTKEDGVCLVRATKQRDLAEGFEIGFRWHPVEIGLDEDAEPVTSLVLEPTDERPAPETRLPKAARASLELLWSAAKDEGEHLSADEAPGIAPHFKAIPEDRWRELFEDAGVSKAADKNGVAKQFRRARDALIERGRVRVENGWAWPISAKRDTPSGGGQVEMPWP